MSDIIKLLPDSVANQIAAGEVIQRPASAVKELMENAVDSGASDIHLIIKDAGKSLIQVTDNGCGMTETDARLSIERHATSKIESADDLFAIRTMGFRGEAMASITAIAHVEIKTRRLEDELGVSLIVEGSKVKSQEAISCQSGTSISVKNLFFNVPARRNFLKSDAAELRHIIEEFHRLALVYPGIAMTLTNNGRVIYQLKQSNLRQRIVNILGHQYNERLIPVEQETENVIISGFVGKPEFAKKTRGEQYFFANKRFIKHAYLNHAIQSAFQELLPKEAFPSYYIYIDIDPKLIDVNIHPTKTEVNFQDSKLIYAVLRSAIKQSLGKFNVTPTIDFEVEQSFDIDNVPKDQPIRNPFYREENSYNPFDSQGSKPSSPSNPNFEKPKTDNWEMLYEVAKQASNIDLDKHIQTPQDQSFQTEISNKFFQLHNKYIITAIKSGLMVIDQRKAHFRILYEQYFSSLENHKSSTQKELFPITINFSAEDAAILKEIRSELEIIGFSIKDFGKNTFVVDGTPMGFQAKNIEELIEGTIENYKNDLSDINIDKKIGLARAMALNMAIRHGQKLETEEMQAMVDKLFRCQIPDKTPDGKNTFHIIPFDEIEKKFS
jgi:DNA mismatch repair protein MutL